MNKMLYPILIICLAIATVNGVDSECQSIQAAADSGKILTIMCDPADGKFATGQRMSDGQLFCVDPSTGKILSQPSSDVVTCACFVKAAQERETAKTPDYAPQCDNKTGEYLSQQCNRNGDCWCSDANGGQLGPRWNTRETVVDLSKPQGQGPPRPSCDFIRNIFSSRPRRKT